MGVGRTAVFLALLVAFGCSGDDDGAPEGDSTDVVITAEQPAALGVAPSGTLLVGERLTGRVLAVPAPYDGAEPEFVTSLAVTADEQDQRGLLGLAVDESGRVFASYTRADDGRLVVAEIADAADDGSVGPGDTRLVWEGPVSAERANGGHLVVGPDGRLVVGVGDLLDGGRVDDPAAPNGKMLALDPDGPAGQRPAVLSAGWNNPFAFTVDADGVLWVADNAGPSGTERIGRGDLPDAALSELRPADDQMAPSGLVVLGGDTLGVCGFLTGQVLRIDISGDRAAPTSDVVAEPCRQGAVVLVDGRLALADSDAVVITP